jgi:predicted ATPase
MSRYLYIKNYKGFDEIILNLLDVNFFVGENSTGKTSILKLISILCGTDFWFYSQFNVDDVELGYFDEIKNKNSEDKYFRIGLENKDNSADAELSFRILLEFEEYKSVPKLKVVKFSTDKYDFLLKISTKQIRYIYKPRVDCQFISWVNDFVFKGNYKIIDGHFNELPLMLVLSFVAEKVVERQSKSTIDFMNRVGLFKKYLWVAPIRAKAKRIYESYEIKYSPEGNHVPSLLKELLFKTNKKNRERFVNILNQFGRESNLFDEIKIKNLGNTSASPFEIIVVYGDTEIKITDVGYGVSQALPLIVGILSSKGYAFSIQQPEVHLHPKAQAAFGSVVYSAAVEDGNNFLIETHSDYTINRFRYCLSKHPNEKVKSQVMFFRRVGNNNVIESILIGADGRFLDNIPDNYREFFIDEEIKLLEI